MIFRWSSKWMVLVTFCCALPVGAQTAWPAGEYLAAGGWGSLMLKPAAQGKQAFELFALGANGHSCSLSGDIRNGRAVLKYEGEDGSCTIDFTRKNGRIQVTPEQNDACHSNCGMRAWFDGEYEKPAAGCDTKSLQLTRNTFKKLYDRKDYVAAERTLAPVLQRCKRTLYWLEDLEIRNDLALTQAKLGKGAACRQTLKPLVADAAKYTGDKNRDRDAICNKDDSYLPPADCYSYLPLVRAAKTNLQWCARAKK